MPSPDLTDLVDLTKRCTACGEARPLTDFPARRASADGLDYRCRACIATARAARRGADPDGTRQRARTHQRRYSSTDKGRAATVARRRALVGTPQPATDKQKARQRLAYALKTGALTRPSTCAKCGATGRIHGHHHRGYDRPLDVVWLCPACHGEEHHAQS